jgi:ubiquinone/menaquinone biosynthesis C-methylase UbiE
MNNSFLLSISEWFRARHYQKDLGSLLELLSPSKNDCILDVGAGTGWIASRIAELCDETYALEPKQDRVEYIKKKHTSVKAFSATSQSVPFPENYFDKIYSVFAFHHFGDQDDTLEEFRRILKPNGMLLIQEFYPESKPIVEKARFLGPKQLNDMLSVHRFRQDTVRDASVGYFLLAQKEPED